MRELPYGGVGSRLRGRTCPAEAIDCNVGEAQLSVRTYSSSREVDAALSGPFCGGFRTVGDRWTIVVNTPQAAQRAQALLGGRVVITRVCERPAWPVGRIRFEGEAVRGSETVVIASGLKDHVGRPVALRFQALDDTAASASYGYATVDTDGNAALLTGAGSNVARPTPTSTVPTGCWRNPAAFPARREDRRPAPSPSSTGCTPSSSPRTERPCVSGRPSPPISPCSGADDNVKDRGEAAPACGGIRRRRSDVSRGCAMDR